jgi:hypothetical protein
MSTLTLSADVLNTIMAPINREMPAPIDADLLHLVKSINALNDAGILEDTVHGAIAKVAPVQVTPAKPTVSKSASFTVTLVTPDNHAYIRMVACELALIDIGWGDVVGDGYTTIDMVPTIADVNERYSYLRHFAVTVDGLNFGRNSDHYREAAALVA